MVFDPVNPPKRYSASRTAHRVNFYCEAPEAREVCLSGDFNNWSRTSHPMTHMPDGRWMCSLELRHGHHQYVFIVDGKPVLDPNAAGRARNERSEPVSLIAVS